MHVESFTVSPFAENCYVCHDAGEAVLIDPGTVTQEEREHVLAYVEAHDLRVVHLLLTHAHIDHIFGCAFFARYFDLGWQMHADDLPLLRNARTQGQMFNVPVEAPPEPVALLSPGDTVAFGGAVWEVLHCPGHSPGSICFYDAANGFVVAGDVLFEGSVGRTDLWGGSMDTLAHSIRTHLYPLPDTTVVYPGHGPATTIGAEKASNPFVRAEG